MFSVFSVSKTTRGNFTITTWNNGKINHDKFPGRQLPSMATYIHPQKKEKKKHFDNESGLLWLTTIKTQLSGRRQSRCCQSATSSAQAYKWKCTSLSFLAHNVIFHKHNKPPPKKRWRPHDARHWPPPIEAWWSQKKMTSQQGNLLVKHISSSLLPSKTAISPSSFCNYSSREADLLALPWARC